MRWEAGNYSDEVGINKMVLWPVISAVRKDDIEGSCYILIEFFCFWVELYFD
jgi:hypothetical protein